MTAQTTMIAMVAETIEVDGKWWIDVSMNGHKLKRQGPFPNADVAKTKTDQLIEQWQPKTPAVPATTNDVVILNGKPVALDSDLGRKLVISACRAGEGVITDAAVIDEFEISISEFEAIKTNTKLGRLVREEGRRRVANGQRARDAAQGIFVKAPAVLDSILSNEASSPRHRIEACREVRQVALGPDGAENAPDAGQPFIIRIDLSAAPGGEVIEVTGTTNQQPKQIEGEVDAEQ